MAVGRAADRRMVEAGREMTGPGSGLTFRAAGPSLESLHQALAHLARALSGQLLVPSWSGYYFYEGDDEVRLHVDTPLCNLTMVIVVMGTLGALHLHPELRGTAPAELQRLEADPGVGPGQRRTRRPFTDGGDGVSRPPAAPPPPRTGAREPRRRGRLPLPKVLLRSPASGKPRADHFKGKNRR